MTDNPIAGGVVAALDIGGTMIKGSLTDAGGAQLTTVHIPTPRGEEEIVSTVRGALADLTSTTDALVGVGVAVPGAVDLQAGVARYSANLGWRDLPLTAFTEGVVKSTVPVVFEHDVRCAGFADLALGATRDIDDACVIVVGTGIAAVSIAGGSPIRGAQMLAGEIGHLPVVPDGEQCGCGQSGCLEVYASAAAISRRYETRTGMSASTDQVIAAVGYDTAAAEVWNDALRTMGLGCLAVAMVNDPAVIAFAGGLSEAGTSLTTSVGDLLAERLSWRSAPQVVVSPLGSRAGLCGIALHTWEASGQRVDRTAWAREMT